MDEIPQIQDPSAYYVQAEQSGSVASGLSVMFADCAFPATLEAVLNDPERDVADVFDAALCENRDFIFGEDHRAIQTTMAQISELVRSAPAGHFGGIALEVPVEVQEVLTPDALSSLSREEFIGAYFELDIQGRQNTLYAMLNDEGMIDGNQFEAARRNEATLHMSESYSEYVGSIYDMAQIAAEHQVPIYAADVERYREIAASIHQLGAMSLEEFAQVLGEGMDDTSDVAYLAALGLDVGPEGKPLIVHRGDSHVNGKSATLGVETQGFDDVLEANGRRVFTIGVVEQGVIKDAVPDPLDVTLAVDRRGNVELDRNANEPSGFFERLFGR